VTVAVLIGIGVIATDPVRQVKESRNLQIQNASIEEIQIQTLLKVTNTSGPDVLTNDPAFFFSRQHLKNEMESNKFLEQRGATESKKFENDLKNQAEQQMMPNQPVTKKLNGNPQEFGLHREINSKQKSHNETELVPHNQNKDEVNDFFSSGGQSVDIEEVTSEIIVSPVSEAVTTTVRVSADPENFDTTIRVFPGDGDVTNVARLPAKFEDGNLTDVQTLKSKHGTRENVSAQKKPIHLLLNATESTTEANSLYYISEDKIYYAYEGSAHYELSHDSSARDDMAISQEKSDKMSEGSSDMQLNMHLALENNMEEGSGEEDHVKQHTVESTEEEYFTALEDDFENQIDQEFLEVNNKVPRLLQASIAPNNGISNKMKTTTNKKKVPVETHFSSDQFLIDLTN